MAVKKNNRDEKGHFTGQRKARTVYVLDFGEDGWCPELAMTYLAGRRVTTCDAAVANTLRRYAASCVEKEAEA